MKKIVFLAAFVCCTAVATAQNLQGKFSLKPMAGINVTSFNGGVIDEIYHNRVRFTAGMEAEYGVTPWLGISLGAIYSQQGAKVEGGLMSEGKDEKGVILVSYVGMKGKLNSEYINVPLMANFYIPYVKGLAVKTGIQLGLLASSKMNTLVQTITAIYDPNEVNQLVLRETDNNYPKVTEIDLTQNDVCKSVDFGIPVGLSYEYKNVVLDARYYFGLTKIDNTPEPEDVRNRHFSFTLGYRFRL